MQIKPLQQDKEIEKAIIMLVDCVSQKCRNTKPLILHSLRIGFKLLDLGQPKEVVIAGILHDLLEDTDCKLAQIKKDFGPKVAKLVLALTQEHIKDYQNRRQVLIAKIKKAGQGAMTIKIADASDNLAYVSLVKDKEKQRQILWKHQLVIKELRPELECLEIFKEYEKKYKMTVKNLKTEI